MPMRFLIICTIFYFLGWCALWAQPAPTSTNNDTVNSQISLQAKVVQIVLNDEHRQGVDWEAIVSDYHSLQLKKEDNPVWADKKFRLSVGEVSEEDYAVLLDALDTVGQVVQSDFPEVVLKKDEPQTVSLAGDPKILPPIHLDILWYISATGEAKIKIEPAINMIIKDSSKPTTPVILRAQTQVTLKNNSTIIIGGLMREDEITKMHKFPLLGDLPLVGLVFRKQGKLMHKTETIVFMTVRTNNLPGPQEQK